MIKTLALFVSLLFAPVLLSGCFGQSPPSGQELIKKASEAAAAKESVTLEATLEGEMVEDGQSAGGSIKVSAISDTAVDGNGELRVGNSFELIQLDQETYLNFGGSPIRIDTGETVDAATEDTPLEAADQMILEAALSGAFDTIEAEAKVSEGPEIGGEKTWVWRPNLAEVDLRETLRQALEGAYREAQREDKLTDEDVREVEDARAEIDKISNEDLDKLRIVSEGIELDVYFGKESGLHIGSRVAIGWSADELRQVFGDSIDAGLGSVRASIDYTLDWSDSPAAIIAPEGAVDANSPAGQKGAERILSDLGLANLSLGALFGLTGVSTDDLLTPDRPAPGKTRSRNGKSAGPLVGMACASLPPGSRQPGKNCIGSKND